MAMQKLNVRFSDETKDYISSTAARYEISDSDIARAAIQIGLDSINKEAQKLDEETLIKYYILANQ